MKTYYETPTTLEGIIRELNFIKETGKVEHITDLIEDIEWMNKEQGEITLEKWNELNQKHAEVAYEHAELQKEYDQLQHDYDFLLENGIDNEFE